MFNLSINMPNIGVKTMSDILKLRAMMYGDKYMDNPHIEENAMLLAEAALNEATYYGKNKYLLEAEAIFDDMLRDYQSRNQIEDLGDFCDNPRFDKVGKCFAKCFGFKDVNINNDAATLIYTITNIFNPYLIIDDDGKKHLKFKFGMTLEKAMNEGMPNAHTATGSHLTKIVRNIKSKGQMSELIQIPGEKREVIKLTDSYSYNLSLFLHPTLFYNHGEASLTGAELTAICLHEIGHNFYKADFVRTAASIATECFGNKLKMIAIAEIIRTGIDIFDNYRPREMNSFIRSIINIPNKIYASLASTAGSIYMVVVSYKSARNALAIAKNVNYIKNYFSGSEIKKKIILSTINYDNEKYADSFTAAYGYGIDQVKALEKLELIHDPFIALSNEEIEGISAVLTNTVALLKIPTFFFTWFLDGGHGTNMTRMKNILDYMEESNLNIKDPKLRKEYDQQLQIIKDMREEIKNPPNFTPTAVTKAALAIIQDILNCSDIRDLISHIKPKVHQFANLDYAD